MVNLSDAFILIAIVVLAILVIVLVVEGKQMKTRPSRGAFLAFLLIIAGIMFAPLAVLIIFRILNEEEVLLRELPAYREYYWKVRYRLVPGVW
jgi:protein-S-isoprenylcysteine O-methyltransferase Ste14